VRSFESRLTLFKRAVKRIEKYYYDFRARRSSRKEGFLDIFGKEVENIVATYFSKQKNKSFKLAKDVHKVFKEFLVERELNTSFIKRMIGDYI
jgi:hypothetical protein